MECPKKGTRTHFPPVIQSFPFAWVSLQLGYRESCVGAKVECRAETGVQSERTTRDLASACFRQRGLEEGKLKSRFIMQTNRGYDVA